MFITKNDFLLEKVPGSDDDNMETTILRNISDLGNDLNEFYFRVYDLAVETVLQSFTSKHRTYIQTSTLRENPREHAPNDTEICIVDPSLIIIHGDAYSINVKKLRYVW